MKKRSWALLAICAVWVVLASEPARAAVYDNTAVVKHKTFRPGKLVLPYGQSVGWENDDNVDHTATSVVGSPLVFDVDLVAHTTDGDGPFGLSGVFKYKCTIHHDMKGALAISGTVSSDTTTVGTPVQYNWASSAPGSIVFDIQQKIGRHWLTIFPNTAATGATVGFGHTGKYQYRSRTKTSPTGTVSGWSPVTTITVT